MKKHMNVQDFEDRRRSYAATARAYRANAAKEQRKGNVMGEHRFTRLARHYDGIASYF